LCADYSAALPGDLPALISPKNSHMDFNIACALHFASKGDGFLFDTQYFLSSHFQQV
jgi:hypothetical protein